MLNLNLPAFEYKIKKAEGKLWIFDLIRKKYIVLIPEEWVRQHFLHYIIHELKYPKSLIKVEGGLAFNQLQKRTDIVVYDRDAKPWMVIECKAPDVKLNEKAISQASMYNKTLNAKFIVVTNGLVHFFAQIDWESRETKALGGMPSYE
jgi:hypothetical protein